jgi:hypothetical protein
LELPFDLGLPNNSTLSLFEGEGPLAGWEDVGVTPLPGLAPMREGLWAGTSLWFRRVWIDTQDPLGATEKAFGKVFDASAGRLWVWRRRLRKLRPHRKARWTEARTVLQLTRIQPAPAQVNEEWLSDQFDAGVRKLNDYLVSAAAVTQDRAVGPVSRQDFPMVVPYFLGDIFEQHPPLSMFILHVDQQVGANPVSPGQADHIKNLVAKQHAGGHPFWLLGEALVETRRALGRGRAAHAVIEAETAFEVLVGALVRELVALDRLPTSRVEGIRNAGLKNVLVDHLPQLSGLHVDLEDRDNVFGAWWTNAYLLRNRVVHEGYRPTLPEAWEAANYVKAVVDHVGLELAKDERTRDIGLMVAAPRDYDLELEAEPEEYD